MKKTPQTNPIKSNNFANAFFSIKDMQAEYQQINGSPVVPQPSSIQKKPINQPKSVSKLNNIVKTQVKKDLNPKLFGQKVQSTIDKQTFKIAAGKQFQNYLKFLPLNVIQCANKVYELSLDNKKSQWQYNLFLDGIPADQIVLKPEVSFCFNAQDVKQGQLGNCYFVAALASLAVNPWILKDRIPKFKEYGSKSKSFQVNLFESGKLSSILVDNLFSNNYCKPVENDISTMILQKAYAQSYGNFDIISIGHSNDALRDLTGANTIYVDLKDKKELLSSLKLATDSQFAVVIASKPQKVHPSISPKHSYIVLGYQIIQGQLFMRMRDPRGWTKASFEVPSPLVNLAENGIFWVDYHNLKESFQVLTICKLKRNHNYFFRTFDKKQLTKNRGGLLIKTHNTAKVCLSIHQKHKKFFDQNFSYDILRLLVGQIQRKKDNFEVLKTIKADFNAQQVCSMQVELKAGKQYVILGQIGNKKAKQKYSRQMFTISVYSDTDQLQLESIRGNIQVSPFLANYITENKSQFQESSSQQSLFRYRGPIFGYVCMLYQNRGKKNVLETIQYPVVKNVEITEKRVTLAPHTSKLLMHAIGPQKNCSFQCSTSTKTVYS